MLPLEDQRWDKLQGGYGVRYDPRPALAELESGRDVEAAWRELWDGLHHQGDIGDASLAAVPHLIRIHKARGVADANTYALVSTIELCRRKAKFKPAGLLKDHLSAIKEMVKLGGADLERTVGLDDVRYILGAIAIAKGAFEIGTLLTEFGEDEIADMLEQYLG